MNEKNNLKLAIFQNLKMKYKANDYSSNFLTDPLYLILQKAELRQELNQEEYLYLKNNKLEETIAFIQNQEKTQTQIKENFESCLREILKECQQLLILTPYFNLEPSSPLLIIIAKLCSGFTLTDLELAELKKNSGIRRQNLERHTELQKLKIKYKASNKQTLTISNRLYEILKKLEDKMSLSNSEIEVLKNYQLEETLEIYQLQETRKLENFIKLKEKYQATKDSETSVSSVLYQILQKLETQEKLSESDLNYLERQNLTETLELAKEVEKKREFFELKVKYQASDYSDSSTTSHFYKVLKLIDLDQVLSEADINFLSKRKLTKTLQIYQDNRADNLTAKIALGEPLKPTEIHWLSQNGYEQKIGSAHQKNFSRLKSKFGVDESEKSDNLYIILQKLEMGARLDSQEVIYLQTKDYFWSKIRLSFHYIEAVFYEQEYKKTKDKWNLANASSHWRKAEQSEKALALTETINFEQIQNNRLKSALLTTQGGAYRDLGELDKAENSARQAVTAQPQSFHPYTLMGAICYELGRYSEGDKWFEEALKRGGEINHIDSELKGILKKIKDKVQLEKVVNYLWQKDPYRYAWAKDFLKHANKSELKTKKHYARECLGMGCLVGSA